jgi:beta-lactamase superfamily II metal-dependent hydrolase
MDFSNKADWLKNKELHIWIFNVGRGFSAFIRTPHNYGIMIDCGNTDGFNPFQDFIQQKILPYISLFTEGEQKAKSIAQLIITHPHADHLQEFDYIIKKCSPYLLTTPHDNPKEDDKSEHINWDLVKKQNPEYVGKLIDSLREEINRRAPPLRKIGITSPTVFVPGFDYQIYYIKPSIVEKALGETNYTNNISIATCFRMGNNAILLCGDLIKNGTDHLIDSNTNFARELKLGLTMLIASHHGLESGYSQLMFDVLKNKKIQGPIIISEKTVNDEEKEGRVHQNYQNGQCAIGYGDRISFTTRNDGHIYICMGAGNKLQIVCSKDKDTQGALFPEEDDE